MVKQSVMYMPNKSIQEGYISLWKEMIREIKESKWLIIQLFLRDIKGMYKQSFIGVFWTLIIPFFALGTFIILNGAGIVIFGEIDVPYPLFAIIGLAFWQIFSIGIITCTNSITNAGGMISKINFPRETLVFSAMGQALIAFLIQMVVVLVLFIYYSFLPDLIVVFIPFMLIPVLLFTVGLGLIFSLVNGIMRDLGRVVGMVSSFLLFLTPVMYAKPKVGLLEIITRYNPMYYLIAGPRDLVVHGTLTEPMGYLYSVIFSVFLFLLCWMAFHLTETRIAERI